MCLAEVPQAGWRLLERRSPRAGLWVGQRVSGAQSKGFICRVGTKKVLDAYLGTEIISMPGR